MFGGDDNKVYVDSSMNLYYPKGNELSLLLHSLTALSIDIALPTIVKVIAVTLSCSKRLWQEE